MTNWQEIEYPITKNKTLQLVMLMENMFGQNRKFMLQEYFGKKSTKDFTNVEAEVAIELLLSKNESLMEFYDTNRPQADIPF